MRKAASFSRAIHSALFGASLLLLSAAIGCGGSDPKPGGGTSMQSCTEQHVCVNGSCTCSDGPKKDESCCDPNDSACANSSTRCDEFCKVCK